MLPMPQIQVSKKPPQFQSPKPGGTTALLPVQIEYPPPLARFVHGLGNGVKSLPLDLQDHVRILQEHEGKYKM